MKGPLTGTLGGSIRLDILRAKIAATGELAIGERVTGEVSGTGGVDGTDVTVEVKKLRFEGRKRVMVEEVITRLPQPKGGDVVKYLPPSSTAQSPTGKNLEIRLGGVGIDLETG